MEGIVHLITIPNHPNLLVVMVTRKVIVKAIMGTIIDHTDPVFPKMDVAVTIKFNTDEEKMKSFDSSQQLSLICIMFPSMNGYFHFFYVLVMKTSCRYTVGLLLFKYNFAWKNLLCGNSNIQLSKLALLNYLVFITVCPAVYRRGQLIAIKYF